MGSAVTQEMLRRALEGRRVNIVNPLVALTLLISLLASLAILVVLLWDVVAKSMPVWQERGWSVITNDLSPRPAETGMIRRPLSVQVSAHALGGIPRLTLPFRCNRVASVNTAAEAASSPSNWASISKASVRRPTRSSEHLSQINV